jgi:acetyl esterase/lipase
MLTDRRNDLTMTRQINRIHPTLALLAAALLLVGCSPLSLVNTLSPKGHSVAVDHHRYGGAQRQQLDVFRPSSVVAGSPVVVFFYGGSWKRGDKWKYAFVGRSLANKGYTTVVPDYRLYPEVRFPAFVEDGAKVLSWVRNNLKQAKNGVVVMGHSAGAHTAALLALDPRYLAAAGAAAGTIRGMIGLAGPYGFNPLTYKSIRPIFADVDGIEKAMPVTFSCSATAPLLLLHGKDDRVVIPENSRELRRRVNACEGDVDYVELDDTGHFSIVLGLSDSALLADEAIQTTIDAFLQSLSQQTGPHHAS